MTQISPVLFPKKQSEIFLAPGFCTPVFFTKLRPVLHGILAQLV